MCTECHQLARPVNARGVLTRRDRQHVLDAVESVCCCFQGTQNVTEVQLCSRAQCQTGRQQRRRQELDLLCYQLARRCPWVERSSTKALHHREDQDHRPEPRARDTNRAPPRWWRRPPVRLGGPPPRPRLRRGRDDRAHHRRGACSLEHACSFSYIVSGNRPPPPRPRPRRDRDG